MGQRKMKRGEAGGKSTYARHGREHNVLMAKFVWAMRRGEYRKGQFEKFKKDQARARKS